LTRQSSSGKFVLHQEIPPFPGKGGAATESFDYAQDRGADS